MTQADRIRQFALDRYIAPARAAGLAEIIIRAGDVHKEMGLVSAMPAVCSAIGSSKFDELAVVTRTGLTGPANGANVYFTFGLYPRPSSDQAIGRGREPVLRPPPTQPRRSLDLVGAVVLISCVKSKLSHSACARELYTSAWFKKTRNIVELSGSRWFVLSARYGLVAPDTLIETYDYTLNAAGVGERRAWAAQVLDKLLPEMASEKRIVMFAGHRYREFLMEPLRRRGIGVEVPMKNLRIGEQLSWLSGLR